MLFSLQASSLVLTPVLSHELLPHGYSTGNRSDIIVFMLELLRCWQLCHGLLHMPVLRADPEENRTWNLGPTHFLLPFRGCPLHCPHQLQQGAEHQNTSASVSQSRADEDYALFSATLCIRVIIYSSTTEQIVF